jgi:hypothetical protein
MAASLDSLRNHSTHILVTPVAENSSNKLNIYLGALLNTCLKVVYIRYANRIGVWQNRQNREPPFIWELPISLYKQFRP